MGDKQIDVGARQTSLFQSGIQSIGHGDHGMAEHLAPGHVDGGQLIVDRFVTGGMLAAAGVEQQLMMATIALDIGAQQTVTAVGAPQNHRTGTITEQYAGIAILPVDHAAEHLCRNHQNMPVTAGAHQAVGQVQGIEKTATGGGNVKGGSVISL